MDVDVDLAGLLHNSDKNRQTVLGHRSSQRLAIRFFLFGACQRSRSVVWASLPASGVL